MPPAPSSSSWSFLIDESLTRKLAKALNGAGYSAISVFDAGLLGKHDSVIFRHARGQGQIILTRDTDFLKTALFPPPHAGIIVVRLPGKTTSAELTREILDALAKLAGQQLTNKVYQLEPGVLRQA